MLTSCNYGHFSGVEIERRAGVWRTVRRSRGFVVFLSQIPETLHPRKAAARSDEPRPHVRRLNEEHKMRRGCSKQQLIKTTLWAGTSVRCSYVVKEVSTCTCTYGQRAQINTRYVCFTAFTSGLPGCLRATDNRTVAFTCPRLRVSPPRSDVFIDGATCSLVDQCTTLAQLLLVAWPFPHRTSA